MNKNLIDGKIFLTILILFFLGSNLNCEDIIIPDVYQNLIYSGDTLIFVNPDTGERFYPRTIPTLITIDNVKNPAVGTERGIKFDFKNTELNGTLYYGLYQNRGGKYKYPIFNNKFAKIQNGIAEINIIDDLSGRKDVADWQSNGTAKLGYRIVSDDGRILYDGKLNFVGTGPFEIPPHITEGPFINCVTDSSAIVSFKTNVDFQPRFIFYDKEVFHKYTSDYHEILLYNLSPDKEYKYSIIYGKFREEYKFKTNPKKGVRKAFSFAFSSDSRTGYGGGERDLNGVNSYIMKKTAAFAAFKDVAFFQFTGDMITGYLTSYNETLLQYSNWKRTIEPFASGIPYYVGMGNHENFIKNFKDNSNYGISINSFPFESNSSESAFIKSFVNFNNGPSSEDNSKYDINPNKIDFPPYNEQVYHYTYSNVAVIVLNSNYLYSASSKALKYIGGNPHGYIMDNQLQWFEETMKMFENDKDIDHIFVTIHTPAFPNGGHAHDAMWYHGNNDIRPLLFGKRTDKGIIERRDEFLDVLCNQSLKVVALLTGDEHNYSRMLIKNDMQIYPENWKKPKLEIKNPVWQIVNGAAGAPYYGQETLPWSPGVEMFTSEHIICIFKIDNNKVILEVYNPDTLEFIESIELRK
jgi:hypothetical protein